MASDSEQFRKGTATAVPFRYLGLSKHYFGSAERDLGLAGADEPVVDGVSTGFPSGSVTPFESTIVLVARNLR